MSGPLTRYDFQAFPCYVSICVKCGLVKLNPRWEKNKYQHFYKKKYDFFYRGPEKSTKELFEIDLMSKGQKMRERLSNISLPKKIKMLDIGAGTGALFFSVPGNREVKSYAIEASKKCVPFLRSKGIAVVGTDFSDDFGNGYDFIVARHVLEHSLNPIGLLTKIYSSLKKEGYLYLVVPNAMTFNSKKAGSFFRHPHTYYFNIHTLLKMCLKCGLYAVSAGWEGELWAVLIKTKTNYVIPDISPNDQLNTIKEIKKYRRFSLKSGTFSIFRRVYYRAF